MKNKKISRTVLLVLSCLLLVGAALGITAAAAPTGATEVEIVYKNVSYTGAPRLVLYTDTNKPLAGNQEIRVLFWNSEPQGDIYNENTADYKRSSESSVIIDGKQHQVFMADGVAPAALRKAVYIRPVIVEVNQDGTETVTAYGEVIRYSVFEYAVDMFAAREGAADDQGAMYSQLLSFAAAVQKVLYTDGNGNYVINGESATEEQFVALTGGWADAYYIAEVERYLTDPATDEQIPTGETHRVYSRTPEIHLSEEQFITVGESSYMFAGFKNLDDSFVQNNMIDGDKVVVSNTYERSTEVVANAPGVGVVFYKAVYTVPVGKYYTFDDELDRSTFATDAKYWEQFGLTTNSSSVFGEDFSKLSTADIYIYYLISDGEEVEIDYFYTANGAISKTKTDYRYIALDPSKTGKNMLVSGKLSSTTGLVFFNVKDNAELQKAGAKETSVTIDDLGVTIKRKTVTVSNKGYTGVFADPKDTSAAAANKVLTLAKHAVDINNPSTVITKGGNAFDGSINSGYVYCMGQLNDSYSAIITNNNATFLNQSPQTYFDENRYVTHILEWDMYLDSNITSTLHEVYWYTGTSNIWAFNTNMTADGQVWLGLKAGPGFNDTGKIFLPGGAPMGKALIAGSNGGVTAGKAMQAGEWYKIRMEYVAEADNKVTIRTYIDGQLASYIRDDAAANGDGVFYEDDYLSKVEFRHNNGTRDTRLSFDNVYMASIGVTEKESAAFDDGRNPSWGNGEYYQSAQDFPSSYKTGNASKHKIIQELDADGNVVYRVDKETGEEAANTVLHMLKSDGAGGGTTNFPTVEKNGNIYVFETDFNIVGTDNLTSWNSKMQFIADIAGGDGNEFMMLCFSCREDAGGKYWTLSQTDSIITDSNGQAFKGMLGKWYNLHFEYDPITNMGDIYINGEYFATRKMGQSGSIKEDTVFAGVGMNIRAYPQGTVYTEILFDNTIATTINTDNFGAGANVDKSEGYDEFVAGDGISVETDDFGKHINVTDGTVVSVPEKNKGKEYVYETDIKWNGVRYLDAASEGATIASLVLYSGENAILTIDGYTKANDSGLYLKAEGVGLGKLTCGYWANLRVVLTLAEPEVKSFDVEDEDGNTVTVDKTVYGGNVEVFINNGSVWSGTVESISQELVFVPNLTIDRAEFSVSSEAGDASCMLDNTFVGSGYVDNVGNGSNASGSNDFETPDDIEKDQYITGSALIGAVINDNIAMAEAIVKFTWNGTFANATSDANVAQLDIVDASGNILATVDVTVNKITGKLTLAGIELELDTYYNIKIATVEGATGFTLLLSSVGDSTSSKTVKINGNTAGFAGFNISAAESAEIYLDRDAATAEKHVIKELVVNTAGNVGTTYLFATQLKWGVTTNEFNASETTLLTLSLIASDGETAILTLYGVVAYDELGNRVMLLSTESEADAESALIALAENVNYDLTVRVENGEAYLIVDGEKISIPVSVPAVGFGSALLAVNNDTVGVNVKDYIADAFDGYIIDKAEFSTTGTTGAEYGFAGFITAGYNGAIAVGSHNIGKIGFVNIRGEEVLSVDVVLNKQKSGTKMEYHLDGELLASVDAGVAYDVNISVKDGQLSFAAVIKDQKINITATAKVDQPDSLKTVTVSAYGNAYLLITGGNAYVNDEFQRVDGTVGGLGESYNTESIGTGYTYETDFRVYWNGIFAADVLTGKIFEIDLLDASGNAFMTIYGLADASDPDTVKLALSEDASAAFYTIPAGVWDNISVSINEGAFSITMNGKERAAGEIVIPETFVKAVVTAYGDTIVDVDNTFIESNIENFKGKGDNKDGAIDNYITAGESGEIEYDPILGEVDPDDEFTDAYIETTKTQISMGKQTAMANNALTFLGSGYYGSVYVFETDLFWTGTTLGTVSGGDAVFHTMTILGTKIVDGEETEVALATLYAVGICYADTTAPDVQYLALYTSLEEGSEPVAVIRQELWYNIRFTYDTESGDTAVYVNNNEVAVVDGEAVEDVDYKGTKIELGSEVYDTVIRLQKTYIGTN